MITTLPKAGPELDQAVCSIVMGFVWDERRCRICGWPLYESVDQGCVQGNCCLRPAPKTRADGTSPYSTDRGLIWDIIEKVKNLCEGDFTIQYRGGLYGSEWWAGWETEIIETALVAEIHSYGGTPMEAVCRAALRGMESKKKS